MKSIFLYAVIPLLFAMMLTESLQGQAPGPSPLRVPETNKIELGVDAARKGQVDEASRLFREAMEAAPGMAPPGLNAAAAWARQSDSPSRFDKVRFWIEKTAMDYPADPEAFLLLAEMAVTDGRLVEANLLLRHAQPLVEALPVEMKNIAKEEKENKENVKEQEEAKKEAKEDASIDPAVRKRTLQGRTRMIAVAIAERKQDWTEAAKLLEAILADWPEHTELLLRLGRIHFKSGDREKGIETLRQGVEKNPAWSLLPLIVELYEQEGLREEARQYLTQSLEAAPDDPKVLAQAAELEIKWNDLPSARKSIDRLAGVAGDDLHLQRLQGVLALYDKDFATAETRFETVIERRPEDAIALSGLVLALCESSDEKKLRRAQHLASDFYRRHPDAPDAATALALVALWRGQTSFVRDLLEEKYESGEMGALGAYYLAVALDRLGERDEAILFLRSGLERPTNFPQRQEAEQMLQRLESR